MFEKKLKQQIGLYRAYKRPTNYSSVLYYSPAATEAEMKMTTNEREYSKQQSCALNRVINTNKIDRKSTKVHHYTWSTSGISCCSVLGSVHITHLISSHLISSDLIIWLSFRLTSFSSELSAHWSAQPTGWSKKVRPLRLKAQIFACPHL